MNVSSENFLSFVTRGLGFDVLEGVEDVEAEVGGGGRCERISARKTERVLDRAGM